MKDMHEQQKHLIRGEMKINGGGGGARSEHEINQFLLIMNQISKLILVSRYLSI
jgi:hypothetical protein